MTEQKLKPILSFLVFLETVYVALSLGMVFCTMFLTAGVGVSIVDDWVIASYFLLPALLFKNIVVATLNKGVLTSRQKLWMLARCAVYFLLTVYSYPLIVAL